MVPIRSLDDLTAALAVVRPGAAAGQAKVAYVRRARGVEAARAPYPALEARLASTFGVLLYEEDVIHLLHTLRRCSLAEADELRAWIVSHGDDAEGLANRGDAFVSRAVEK
jgi:DNA polymerase III alpha subunit